MTATATTAIDKPAKPATLKQWLQDDRMKDQIARALPRHLSADRFMRVAMTAITKTPMLAQCDQASFFNALLTLSQFGLEPDGRRAHLIPFRNNKRGVVECQLIIDYKGLAELVMRSGMVSFIHADVVCENDDFEYDRGEVKRHKIDLRNPRGKIYAAYAICRFKDGTEKADVMSLEEIEAIRSRSRAGRSGPWVTDFSEMAKKTVFRRLSKWLPLSPELHAAIEADDDQYQHGKPHGTSSGLESLKAQIGDAGDQHDVIEGEVVEPGAEVDPDAAIEQAADDAASNPPSDAEALVILYEEIHDIPGTDAAQAMEAQAQKRFGKPLVELSAKQIADIRELVEKGVIAPR